MDIGLLERSEHVKPLLVKLYDTHRVYKLAGDRKPEARSELGHVVSALLDVSVGDREKDLVTDILLALIQQAGVNLRQSLANKFAQSDTIPSRLALHFAYDEIEVAENILKYSPVLETLDLMYILQSKPEEYWRAIAVRDNLSEELIDELSVLPDDRTHANLAGNDHITLTEAALGNLVESAKTSDMVARPLIERSDVPKALVKKIYTFVGEQIQALIQEKYGIVSAVTDTAVKEAIQECIGEEPVNPYLPSDALMLSERTKVSVRTERETQVRGLMLQEMQEVLRLRHYKSFVAKFAVFMGIRADEAIEILSQQYGHGLAILCRAHSIDRNDFIKMFLLSDPIRSDRGQAMKGITLTRALSYYDRLSPELARDLYQKNFLTS